VYEAQLSDQADACQLSVGHLSVALEQYYSARDLCRSAPLQSQCCRSCSAAAFPPVTAKRSAARRSLHTLLCPTSPGLPQAHYIRICMKRAGSAANILP
jgi:hypothetical protein